MNRARPVGASSAGSQSDAEREKTVERMKELQKTSPPVQTKP